CRLPGGGVGLPGPGPGSVGGRLLLVVGAGRRLRLGLRRARHGATGRNRAKACHQDGGDRHDGAPHGGTTRQNHATSIAAPPTRRVSWLSSGPLGLPTNGSKDYEIGSAGLRRLFVLPLVASVVSGLAGPASAATAPVPAAQGLTA